MHTVECCSAASEWLGLHCKGGMTTSGLCPLDISPLRGPWAPWGGWCWSRTLWGNGASVFQPPRIWRPVTGPVWPQGAGWGLWWLSEHRIFPLCKCDMQKLTVDELKRLLYDTFCEHLSMKDIENIIMTEEESHLGTAEECPVDVESK